MAGCDAAGAGDDDDEGVVYCVDDDEKEEEKEETPEPEKKPARAPRKPREPSPEPSFELPKHLREYEGHPEDRKASMAWRAELNKVSNQLAIDKREYEKRKRAELRKQQGVAWSASAGKRRRRRSGSRRKPRRSVKEKEARKKEAKRMDEDAAVSVRTRSLGKDRLHRTLLLVGGRRDEDVVYVEETDGARASRKRDRSAQWTRCTPGARGAGGKQALQRRRPSSTAEFRKRARAEEENGDGEESKKSSTSVSGSSAADESVPGGGARAAGAICALRR